MLRTFLMLMNLLYTYYVRNLLLFLEMVFMLSGLKVSFFFLFSQNLDFVRFTYFVKNFSIWSFVFEFETLLGITLPITFLLLIEMTAILLLYFLVYSVGSFLVCKETFRMSCISKYKTICQYILYESFKKNYKKRWR